MNELRVLACAVLLNLGVGALLGVGIARQVSNQLAGQQTQREGLAAAGHGTDTGRSTGIAQDRFLSGAQPDAIRRYEIQDGLVQVRWRTARARGVGAG